MRLDKAVETLMRRRGHLVDRLRKRGIFPGGDYDHGELRAIETVLRAVGEDVAKAEIPVHKTARVESREPRQQNTTRSLQSSR